MGSWYGGGSQAFRKTRGLSVNFAAHLHGGRPVEWATLIEPLDRDPHIPDTGTRRLIRAVLVQAISDLTGRSITHGDARWRATVNHEAAAAAAAWFTVDLPDVPFSFAWCCDALHLAHSRLRRNLLAATRRDIPRGTFTNGRPRKSPKTPRRYSVRVKVNTPPVDTHMETPLKNPLVGTTARG